MSWGDYFYLFAAALFAYMTFAIIRGNFRRKFNDDGERLDLVKNAKEQKADS